jgi:hypothetical protein
MPGTYGTSQPTYRSVAVIAELQADLALRTGMTLQAGSVLGFDSSGNPTLQLGDATSEHQNASIRCLPIGTWGKDIVGNTQNDYANHIIQVSAEKDVTTNSAAVETVLSAANLMGVLAEALRWSARVELYSTTANGTVTASDTTGANAFANFSAANLLMVWEPHVQYPLIGTM